MKKTFEYNGVEMEIYASPSKQGGMFVEVKSSLQRYGKGTQMIWNKERGWIKKWRYALR